MTVCREYYVNMLLCLFHVYRHRMSLLASCILKFHKLKTHFHWVCLILPVRNWLFCFFICYLLVAFIQNLHTQYCGQSPQEQFGVKCLRDTTTCWLQWDSNLLSSDSMISALTHCATCLPLCEKISISFSHPHRVSTVDPFHKECLSCALFKSKCSYYDASISPQYQNILLNGRGTTVTGCDIITVWH